MVHDYPIKFCRPRESRPESCNPHWNENARFLWQRTIFKVSLAMAISNSSSFIAATSSSKSRKWMVSHAEHDASASAANNNNKIQWEIFIHCNNNNNKIKRISRQRIRSSNEKVKWKFFFVWFNFCLEGGEYEWGVFENPIRELNFRGIFQPEKNK